MDRCWIDHFTILITTHSKLLTVMGAGKQVVFSSSTLKVRVMNFSTSLDHQISQISFSNLEKFLKFGWFLIIKNYYTLKFLILEKYIFWSTFWPKKVFQYIFFVFYRFTKFLGLEYFIDDTFFSYSNFK